MNERNKIMISKELVTLCTEVPLDQSIDDLSISRMDPSSFLSFTREMEFRTLSQRLRKEFSISDEIDDAFVSDDKLDENAIIHSTEEKQVFDSEGTFLIFSKIW